MNDDDEKINGVDVDPELTNEEQLVLVSIDSLITVIEGAWRKAALTVCAKSGVDDEGAKLILVDLRTELEEYKNRFMLMVKEQIENGKNQPSH